MFIKLEVTKKNIQKASQLVRSGKDISNFDPIAMAIKSYGYKNPLIETNTFYFKKNGVEYSGKLPKYVQKFVEQFDEMVGSKEMVNLEPLSITLNAKVS